MIKNYLLQITVTSFLFAGISMASAGSTFASRIDSIQVVFDDQQLVLPGETFQIGIITYYKNGKIRKTVGMQGGSAWWWGYKVEVSGGTELGGRIAVNETLLPCNGKYVGIKAYPRKQPELAKEVLLPLNYETKISYRPTTDFDKAPGSQIKGELVARFNNGTQRVYPNLRNNKTLADFEFYGEGGSWRNGKFTIDPDFLQITNHRAALIVNSLRNPSASDTFLVLLDYRHASDMQFYGSSGMSGSSGSAGISGSSGSHGGDGQNGQNGEFGYDGPDMGVWVDLYRDSVLNCDLLYVYGLNLWTGSETRYLVNTDGGSLTVTSDGGDGGSGGSGGIGGDGGSGNEGRKWTETRKERKTVQRPVTKKVTKKQKKTIINSEGKEVEIEEDVLVDEVVMTDVEIEVDVSYEVQGQGEDGGDGGWGGAGGFGGEGGYGGNITLYFTDDARPYQHLFVARCEGGSGGVNGSGGGGGRGGSAGRGNPNGSNGIEGSPGPSKIGWADNGRSGQIVISPTEEFFFYARKEKTSEK